MVSFKSLLVTLALGAEALAGAAPKPTCSTKLGTSSVKNVKCQTSTKTQIITQTKVIYKKNDKTVTPKPTTVTVLSTKISTVTATAQQETDTATTTVVADTSTISDTLTNTVWETETDTITVVSTSTSTIATPEGFTPVASQLAAQKSARALAERAAAILERKTSKPISINCDKNGKPVPNTPLYPQAINCVVTISKTVVKTATSTVKGSTITLARPTTIKSVVITKTFTQTQVPPNAKTIITESSTLTVTTTVEVDITSTTTTTSTVQNVVPTTVNGACLSDNLVNQSNQGQGVGGISVGGSVQSLSTFSATNAYDCCVACQNTQFCTGVVWLGFGCFASVDNQCRPGQAVTSFWSTGGSPGGNTVSNGPCGMLIPPS